MRLGDRLCDLSYANPYEGTQERARAVLRAALDEERLLDLQYTPFGGATLPRRAVADSLTASHGLSFGFGDVVLTPGAMSALHIALRTTGAAGAEVLVPVPCWLDYPLYARALGFEPILVEPDLPAFDLPVTSILNGVSARTCALVFSQPANPTGRSYGADALAGLAAGLREAEQELGCEITVVADETHRDFMATETFTSIAAHFDRTIIVYSFGKYHFIQGQRLGYAAVSPRHPAREAVAAELVRWTRVTGIATPTALMQRATAGLLALRYDLSWLDESRERLVASLEEHGYEVVRPDGTFFVYARTPAGHDDFTFTAELAGRGVLTLPAPVFHHSGYFRLALTGSQDMVERALPILADAAAA